MIPRLIVTTFLLLGLLCAARASDENDLGVHPDSFDIPAFEKFIDFEVPPIPIADSCPEPSYPKSCPDSIETGKVWVWVHIDTNGAVEKWQIANAEPAGVGFEEEVGKVLPLWIFTPARLDDKPVAVWVPIPFSFKKHKSPR